MPRRAAKVDANQSEIVAALRDAGVSVYAAHAVGAGFPDLVCGYRGKNHLLEVKDGSKPPSARQLTKDQTVFHMTWNGQVDVVTSPEEALAAVGVVVGRVG